MAEFDPQFKPANPFDLSARINGQDQPAGQAQAGQAQHHIATGQENPQPRTLEVKPMTMGAYAQRVSFNKGDYFSHDMKVYHRDKNGNTWLVTGDAMGDVKLDDDQVAQLEKSRADKAAREKAEKEGPIYTDQVPSGKIEADDYPSPEGVDGKRVDSPFNRLSPKTRQAIIGGVSTYIGKKALGDEIGIAAGIWAADQFGKADEKLPELEEKKQ